MVLSRLVKPWAVRSEISTLLLYSMIMSKMEAWRWHLRILQQFGATDFPLDVFRATNVAQTLITPYHTQDDHTQNCITIHVCTFSYPVFVATLLCQTYCTVLSISFSVNWLCQTVSERHFLRVFVLESSQVKLCCELLDESRCPQRLL